MKSFEVIYIRPNGIFKCVLCHVVYLIFGLTFSVFAQNQTNDTDLIERLVDEGFENIGVVHVKDTLCITYENRRYRFEPRGMALVINIADEVVNNSSQVLELILLTDKVPVIKVILPFYALEQFQEGTITDQEFYNQIATSFDVSSARTYGQLNNSSSFKIDVPIIPRWSAKFGNFDNPVESNISIIPELNSTLAKGLTLKAQLIIPIQNDFFFVAERETIRPGNITLNQFVNLDDNFYLNLTGGFFDKNRAGFNLEIKKAFDEGTFELGSNIGFTGYYSFTGIETEYYDKQKYLTALLNVQYRYNPYDIVARLDVGNYLFNVLAARFEVMRQFGEVQIGFFAVATKDDYDGGFRFSVPIPPGKYTKQRWFRVRPSNSFEWHYRAKGFPQNGVTCNTGYNLTDKLMDYNPDFIKKRLIIEINKRLKK